MCHFFKNRDYPDSVVNTAQHRAQQIDRQSALQMSQKEKDERIPIALTYHPHNLAAKNIILKNFQLLQSDNETGRIFSQPPLVSFKRNKNIGNFLVRSVLKSDDQPGTFKCARKRCNTSPFIHNADKITGPDVTKTGNGEWGMGNGEWGMGNGEWEMANGEWGMGNGEWGMENGEWGMGNGE